MLALATTVGLLSLLEVVLGFGLACVLLIGGLQAIKAGVFEIADLSRVWAVVDVYQKDLGLIRERGAVEVRIEAYPGETFHGTVRQTRNAPQTVQNVVTYDAVIDIDNGALKLKPGMTANVRVVVESRDDVLKVPNAALRYRPAGAAEATGSPSRRCGSRRSADGTQKGPGIEPQRARQQRAI